MYIYTAIVPTIRLGGVYMYVDTAKVQQLRVPVTSYLISLCCADTNVDYFPNRYRVRRESSTFLRVLNRSPACSLVSSN